MKLEVKNISLGVSLYEQKPYQNIYLDVVNLGENKLSIGDGYIFTEYGLYGDDKEKRKVAGQVQINRISSIQGSNNEYWKLSNEKIGEVTFLKEFDNEFGDDEKKAAIAFEIFVNDETFDFIKQNYLHNKLISFLNLGVDFEFSWEPDGSHRIWKVKKEEEKKNTYELDRLDISNFSMIFSNKEEEGELLVEDVKEEEKLQKESISKVFKQIRTIQFYLMGILFILLWFFFK